MTGVITYTLAGGFSGSSVVTTSGFESGFKTAGGGIYWFSAFSVPDGATIKLDKA